MFKRWNSTGRVQVNKDFHFDSVSVSDLILLDNIEFKNNLRITHCVFRPPSRFYDGSSPTHQGIVFDNAVSFEDNRFLQACDFRGGNFLKPIHFARNYFAAGADFTYTTFQDSVSFDSTYFASAVHFECTNFSKRADFSNCHFGQIAYFSTLDFSDTPVLHFTNAFLPDTIDFSNNSYIPSTVDFMEANLDDSAKTHYIFLDRTDISKLNLDYTHFRLLFKDPNGADKTDMPDGTIAADKHIAIYEGLLANFKAKGQFESYGFLNAEYQAFKVRQMSFPDRLWNQYSSKPFNVISVTIIVFLMLSFINIFFYRKLNDQVYALPNFTKEVVEPLGRTKPRLTFREFTHSAMYTAFVFFTFSVKMDDLHFHSRKLIAWFFTIYALGLIALFFLTHLLFSAHSTPF